MILDNMLILRIKKCNTFNYLSKYNKNILLGLPDLDFFQLHIYYAETIFLQNI